MTSRKLKRPRVKRFAFPLLRKIIIARKQVENGGQIALSVEEDRNKITQHYRWQFLRLNRGYRHILDRYREQLNNKFSETNPKTQRIVRDMKEELWKEYWIKGIADYKKRELPRNVEIYCEFDIGARIGSLESVFGNRLHGEQEVSGNYLVDLRELPVHKRKQNDPPIETLEYPIAIQVAINYLAPAKLVKNDLYRILLKLRKRRERYVAKLKYLRLKKTTNDDSVTFDRYLRIYRMREKGMSFPAIAKAISELPNQNIPTYKDYLLAAADKNRKAYQHTLRLIETGYRFITF